MRLNPQVPASVKRIVFVLTRRVHVLQDSRWSGRYYKDGIHPTAEGFKTLANIIKDDLDRVNSVGVQ